jgi:hypothetical protein
MAIGTIIAVAALVLSVASFFLAPKPPSQRRPLAGLDEFDFPTAEAGREIPVLQGTREIRGPNVVWYGHLASWRSGGDDQYSHYAIGVHMVICHGPIDEISRIRVEEKTALSGSLSDGNYYIDKPWLFGGRKKEGGLEGTVGIQMGAVTQTADPYLVARLGNTCPAFRGVVSVILKQMYIGTTSYMKPWAFRCTRVMTTSNGQQQWYPAKAAIGPDMNPAHMIREDLTDAVWGMGYSAQDIDDANFRAVADTLYDEGFGLSLLWSRTEPLEDYISKTLEHIEAVIRVGRVSGQFEIKLLRDDYDPEALLVLDETVVTKVTNYKRPATGELINQVVVTYWNTERQKDDTASADDIALQAEQQGVVQESVDYPGITNPVLASRVAARDLQALSTPLSSCTVYANRRAAELQVGDPFKLSWPKMGIESVIMRVVNIELGGLTDNQVKITCAQDVFALKSALYTPPAGTEWEEPDNAPQAVQYRHIVEAPYYSLVKNQWADAQVAIAAAAPTSDATFAGISSTHGDPGYDDAGDLPFAPVAVLDADMDEQQTVWPVSDFEGFGRPDSPALVGSYAVAGTEVLVVEAATETEVTVGRAAMDTVPVKHLAGERILFSGPYTRNDAWTYAAGQTTSIKLLTNTGQGELDAGLAPVDSVTFDQRAERPYPPANITLNGDYWAADVHGDINVAWAHRNRVTQGATLVDWYAGSITPEVGTTYDIALKQGASVVASVTDVTGTSAVITPPADGEYTLEVISKRDGLTSWLTVSHTFNWTRTEPMVTEAGEPMLTEAGDVMILE